MNLQELREDCGILSRYQCKGQSVCQKGAAIKNGKTQGGI